jgi:hypothetical protein
MKAMQLKLTCHFANVHQLVAPEVAPYPAIPSLTESVMPDVFAAPEI